MNWILAAVLILLGFAPRFFSQASLFDSSFAIGPGVSVTQGFAIGGQQVRLGRGPRTCVCQACRASSTRSGSTARNTRPNVALLGEG